ncbi:MAG: flagellar basal body P-ring formation chaperone FlgA [Candidatus Hydrogenedentota bacterium]
MSSLVRVIVHELGLFRPSLLSRVVASFLICAAPATALTATMHGAEVDGKFISLGDVCAISGINADEAKRLELLSVGFAPPPGRSRVVSSDHIRMRLLQEGFLPQQITLRGEEQIVVSRKGQNVSSEWIMEAVVAELKKQAPADVRIEVVRAPSIPALPLGDVELSVSKPRRMEGQFFVTIELSVGDEVQKENVTLKAVRPGAVVVALKRAERGAILRAEDLGVETRDLFEQPRDAVGSLEAAVGRVLTRPVLPGVVVTSSVIEQETLVKRGDRIRMIVRGRGLEITSIGEAFEPGGIGKIIKVRNVSSNRIISGRITGAGEVSIE